MFSTFLSGLLIIPGLIGLFTIYHWLRPQHPPADTSNRINAIRLWWFALTKEEDFVSLYPWLKGDEGDNV
jgi:hypothetical protein